MSQSDMRAQAIENLDRLQILNPYISPEAAFVISSEMVRRAVVTNFFLVAEEIPVKVFMRMDYKSLLARVVASDLSEDNQRVIASFTAAWVARGGPGQDGKKPVQADYFTRVKYSDVLALKCVLDRLVEDDAHDIFDNSRL